MKERRIDAGIPSDARVEGTGSPPQRRVHRKSLRRIDRQYLVPPEASRTTRRIKDKRATPLRFGLLRVEPMKKELGWPLSRQASC
jgi:hypothetical protein